MSNNSTAETEAPETTGGDGPLLDLTDAGVKKFIKQAKARGYVTMEELNKVLPSEEVTPTRSKTPWPCSARWASTSSRPKKTPSRRRRGRVAARRDQRSSRPRPSRL
jgi:RNA polymerase primary sigma factor